MFLILSIILGLVGLFAFLCGLFIGLMELWDLAPTISIVFLGLTFMSLASVIWLRLLPRRLAYALQLSTSGSSLRNLRQRPFEIVGMLNVGTIQNKSNHENQMVKLQINTDSAETLLKSIRGATYLIQAIQYSLETNIMSEMGQNVFPSSVIHAGPGCAGTIEYDSQSDNTMAPSASPRLSGPEEQWENTGELKWTNQQLKISLNKTSSSLDVFPYSESRPPDELAIIDANSADELATSSQSGLSRVTISYGSSNKHEIRCIGMSSAFLSRFNNSFKA